MASNVTDIISKEEATADLNTAHERVSPAMDNLNRGVLRLIIPAAKNKQFVNARLSEFDNSIGGSWSRGEDKLVSVQSQIVGTIPNGSGNTVYFAVSSGLIEVLEDAQLINTLQRDRLLSKYPLRRRPPDEADKGRG
jgi:hypothetical protein